MITAFHTLVLPPRERVLTPGASGTTITDLLSVLLSTGTAGTPVERLAKKIEPLVLAGDPSFNELCSIGGVGPAKAARVMAGLALAPALAQRQQQLLDSPERIYQACSDLLTEPQEHLVVFFLTIRGTILDRQLVSIGTASASLAHPREVFRAAILSNASHIVLAHNHPSGNHQPSSADSHITQSIAAAGRQIGIELVDHVICSTTGYTSLKVVAPELFW